MGAWCRAHDVPRAADRPHARGPGRDLSSAAWPGQRRRRAGGDGAGERVSAPGPWKNPGGAAAARLRPRRAQGLREVARRGLDRRPDERATSASPARACAGCCRCWRRRAFRPRVSCRPRSIAARAREALEAATDAFLSAHAQFDGEGARIDAAALGTVPREIGLRALAAVLGAGFRARIPAAIRAAGAAFRRAHGSGRPCPGAHAAWLPHRRFPEGTQGLRAAHPERDPRARPGQKAACLIIGVF